MNSFNFDGHVFKDAVTRNAGASTVTTVTIKNIKNRKDKDGNWVEFATYIQYQAWNDKTLESLKKDDYVVVYGAEFKSEQYTDKDGAKRYKNIFERGDLIKKPSPKFKKKPDHYTPEEPKFPDEIPFPSDNDESPF